MTMKRGSVNKANSELVALWVPLPLLNALDRAVTHEDSDRSKFIRRAVRNRVSEMGLTVNEEPAR
jgi:metal-responsive CopG/Arc/MetJ family transcriptional regulator